MIKDENNDIVKTYKFLVVHLNDQLVWDINVDGLRKLRSTATSNVRVKWHLLLLTCAGTVPALVPLVVEIQDQCHLLHPSITAQRSYSNLWLPAAINSKHNSSTLEATAIYLHYFSEDRHPSFTVTFMHTVLNIHTSDVPFWTLSIFILSDFGYLLAHL